MYIRSKPTQSQTEEKEKERATLQVSLQGSCLGCQRAHFDRRRIPPALHRPAKSCHGNTAATQTADCQ